MTRSSVMLAWVGILAAASAGASGCNYAAGVKGDPTGAAAAGSAGAGTPTGAGTAGSTGAAGTTSMMSTGTAGSPFNFGGQYMSTGAGGSMGQTGPCQNIACQSSTCRGAGCTVTCPAGQRTTVSGTIFDPAGAVPLYNITVFVPNATLDDIKDGPSCDPCDPATGTSLLSGNPILFTKTDTAGKFQLGTTSVSDVPAGANVPLVIQVGKWQRQVVLPTVTPCMDNPITDMSLLHLPRTKAEGHIPKIALTTGGSDAMECLLKKIGIDISEFSTEAGTGRVNLYAGGGGTTAFATTLNAGATMTPVNPWWDSLDNLKKYDIVLHSCEGGQGQYDPTKIDRVTGLPQEPPSTKSMQARQALQDFADLGGRVFASHWHAYWFEQGTAKFKSVGTFNHRMGLPNPYDATIDQGFPTGSALAQWMINVQGSTTLGTVTIAQDASTRLIDAAAGAPISQQWIYASTLMPPSVQFLSATTPIPGGTCGRAVISDLHVTAGDKNSGDQPNMPFPTGCVTTTLAPREKVLEFMLFDIASCVAPIVQ